MTHNDYLLVIENELVGCLYLDHFPNDHFYYCWYSISEPCRTTFRIWLNSSNHGSSMILVPGLIKLESLSRIKLWGWVSSKRMQKSTAKYTIEHEKEQKIEKTELVQNFNSSTWFEFRKIFVSPGSNIFRTLGWNMQFKSKWTGSDLVSDRK